MPRQSSYTTEEDRIILETAGQPAEETQERLLAAGFTRRGSNAIKQRRYYLQKRGGYTEATTGATVDDRLIGLLHRRRQLTAEQEELAERQAAVRQEIAKLNQEIHGALREELDAPVS